MTEEPIIIEIDDSQLDVAIMKLDLLGNKASAIIGGGGRGGKKLDTALPGINRELRLILGQVPGMREAMQTYFALKRVERGLAYANLGQLLPTVLTGVATVLLLLRELQRHQRRLEREKEDLERLIRKSRGWTHEEYERGRAEWEEYNRSMPG